jgi:predicted glycoside hydrolase/deacetylase ChbG (UPF0249 family)
MNYGSCVAYAELSATGLVSSGAVMVPCPWFLEVAAYCRAHPEADMGVHLTLTSEWQTYRWGPISTRDPASGLLDGQGYFWHRSEQTQDRADPGAVSVELAAQIARALDAGIDVTHVDAHMGAATHPKLVKDYVDLAVTHRVPVMLARETQAGYERLGLAPEAAKAASDQIRSFEEMGLPLIDHIRDIDLKDTGERIALVKQVIDTLESGITHLLCHPSVDTPELRAITPDWCCRVGDYLVLQTEELRDYISRAGVHMIGYRALREVLRESLL